MRVNAKHNRAEEEQDQERLNVHQHIFVVVAHLQMPENPQHNGPFKMNHPKILPVAYPMLLRTNTPTLSDQTTEKGFRYITGVPS